jgi:hypothetical protein
MVSSSYASFVPWDPRLLYAFRRKGWNVPPRHLRQVLEQSATQTVTHLVIYPTDGLDPALISYLQAHHPIVAIEKTHMTGMVFDVRPAVTRHPSRHNRLAR